MESGCPEYFGELTVPNGVNLAHLDAFSFSIHSCYDLPFASPELISNLNTLPGCPVVKPWLLYYLDINILSKTQEQEKSRCAYLVHRTKLNPLIQSWHQEGSCLLQFFLPSGMLIVFLLIISVFWPEV